MTTIIDEFMFNDRTSRKILKVVRSITIAILAVFFTQLPGFAQSTGAPVKKKHVHAWYFSWGYNGETYTHSNIHVKQSDLGNDYTLNDVHTRDHEGWNDHFLQEQLTIPQYNYRIGYVLDAQRGIGLELNFDHTKHIVSDGQDVRLSGKLGNHTGDTIIHYSEANGFYYYLNNGANFFLINLVKRWQAYESHDQNLRIDALAKGGIGPVIPHVQNSFFGKENDPRFQFGGWNVGVEGDLKVSFFRYVYLEYGLKLDYARYSHLKVYDGTASEAFGTFEQILSLGININGKRHL